MQHRNTGFLFVSAIRNGFSLRYRIETRYICAKIRSNISFEQATQALNECQVKAIVNDTWTLQMSPMGPTPET